MSDSTSYSGWDLPKIEPDDTHRCAEMDELIAIENKYREEHDVFSMVELLHGRAIGYIEKSAGRWWAHNEEYSVLIGHCPFCGRKLP